MEQLFFKTDILHFAWYEATILTAPFVRYSSQTRLSKILLVKKECIEKLREMNTQAEKMVGVC